MAAGHLGRRRRRGIPHDRRVPVRPGDHVRQRRPAVPVVLEPQLEARRRGNRIKPLGTEAGFWRPRPDNQVELLLAHPTGYAEVWVGEVTVTGIVDAQITGARVELQTDVVARTDSAKEVSGGTRLYGLVDGELLWRYDMAAVGEPLTPHLSARLQKA